jgi:transposase InsO family protein
MIRHYLSRSEWAFQQRLRRLRGNALNRPGFARHLGGLNLRPSGRCYEQQGWLYLAVVLDLFSCQVIGWPMQSRIDRELAINALLMAVWRRQPKQEVIVHSDQGSQFSSRD